MYLKVQLSVIDRCIPRSAIANTLSNVHCVALEARARFVDLPILILRYSEANTSHYYK